MSEEEKPSGGTDIIADAMKAADTSVAQALLGRSARAFGDLLGERAEEYVDRVRERRRKNVHDHEQQVEQVTGGPVDFLAAAARGGAIVRWYLVAADVPIEDPEKAAFVEATLAEILASPRSSDFQDVAEKLSGQSMRIVLNAPSGRKFFPREDDRENLETLRDLGLARRFGLPRFLLLLLAWSVGTAAGLYILTRILPSVLPTTMSIGFEVEGAVISGVIFAAAIALLSTNYTLTEFGEKLQASALRFYPTRTKLREFWIASLVPSSFLSWALVALVFACGIPLLLSRFLPGSETFRTIVLSPPPQSPSAAPSPPASTSVAEAPKSTQTLTTEDVANLTDVWRSVSEQTKSTMDTNKQIAELLSSWPKQINEDRNKLTKELNDLRTQIDRRRTSFGTLATFYERFPNIRATFQDKNTDKIFARLFGAVSSFFTEVGGLGPNPENSESTLKPFADEVRSANTALEKWARETHSFSEEQVRELGTAK